MSNNTGKFYWWNRVNGIEYNGPFDTAQAARDNAIKVFTEIQKGMALCIEIVQVVERGHIETVQQPEVRWVSEEPVKTTGAIKSKPYPNMTDDELLEELERLEKAQADAPGWSAAVGVRSEFIKNIKQEQARRVRRVPRYDADVKYSNAEVLRGHYYGGMVTVDGVVTVSALAPWQIDREIFREWSQGSAVKHAAMRAFYKQITNNIFRLEPLVFEPTIPEMVANCYHLTTKLAEEVNFKFLLCIEQVPADLRDCYPHLRGELNAVEFDESPREFRFMYQQQQGKNVLMPEYAAWGKL